MMRSKELAATHSIRQEREADLRARSVTTKVLLWPLEFADRSYPVREIVLVLSRTAHMLEQVHVTQPSSLGGIPMAYVSSSTGARHPRSRAAGRELGELSYREIIAARSGAH